MIVLPRFPEHDITMNEQEIFDALRDEFGEEVILNYTRPRQKQLLEIAEENDALKNVSSEDQRQQVLNELEEEHEKDLTNSDNWIEVHKDHIDDVCQFLKETDQLAFDSLQCLSGMDWGEDRDDKRFGVTYHLHSMSQRHSVTLKIFCPEDDLTVPTVSKIWGGANWHEREAYDMIGLWFEGHPYMKRLFCPEDWEGHPLRKDYEVQEYYRNVRVPY